MCWVLLETAVNQGKSDKHPLVNTVRTTTPGIFGKGPRSGRLVTKMTGTEDSSSHSDSSDL